MSEFSRARFYGKRDRRGLVPLNKDYVELRWPQEPATVIVKGRGPNGLPEWQRVV